MRDPAVERAFAALGFSPFLLHPDDRPGRCPSCFMLLAGRWSFRAWLSVVEINAPTAAIVKVTTCDSHYCRAQVERIARSA